MPPDFAEDELNGTVDTHVDEAVLQEILQTGRAAVSDSSTRRSRSCYYLVLVFGSIPWLGHGWQSCSEWVLFIG